MEQSKIHVGMAVIVGSILLAIILLAGSFLVPWKLISWGRIKLDPVDTITVKGEAKSQQKNQVATFSAGVNAVGDDKQAAIDEVNRKVEAIIAAIQEFGVTSDDVKTQSLNVYQNQEQYYEEGRQKFRPGQWNVSNTVEIKLRDVDRASALANLLTRSGATNIYGPNFALDDTREAETALIEDAMGDAKVKAELVAKAAGRKIRRLVSVAEDGTQGVSPVVYRTEGGGGGGPVESGTGTVSKAVTVTYELE